MLCSARSLFCKVGEIARTFTPNPLVRTGDGNRARTTRFIAPCGRDEDLPPLAPTYWFHNDQARWDPERPYHEISLLLTAHHHLLRDRPQGPKRSCVDAKLAADQKGHTSETPQRCHQQRRLELGPQTSRAGLEGNSRFEAKHQRIGSNRSAEPVESPCGTGPCNRSVEVSSAWSRRHHHDLGATAKSMPYRDHRERRRPSGNGRIAARHEHAPQRRLRTLASMRSRTASQEYSLIT